METITYLNLKVGETPITRIIDLHMENGVNQYGRAHVEGEVTFAEGNDFVNRIQPDTMVTISTEAQGQPQILFRGVIANAGVKREADYAVLTLELSAMAAKLDREKEHRSFQKTGSTYAEIINKALNGRAELQMEVPDHATGSLIMQYNETAWEFSKRMASAFGAPVCADVTEPKPVLTIGIPSTGKSYQFSDVEYGFSSEDNAMSTMLTGTQAVRIGDGISYSGSTNVVKKYKSQMQGGVLKTTVYVMPEGEARSCRSGRGSVPRVTNTQAAGKMFTGVVQEVQRDKVRVHLLDIDESFDGGGDFWFPYSTAYSSSDGSGFYCMPAQNDIVRVFFPSDNEADAFAASSVNVSPLDNPLHKKWRSPAGKEILFTEEGLYITCKDERIFIDLEDETGVTICSDKDISVSSKTNMMLYAKQGITLHSENKILISTGEAYIDITDKLIQMGAQQILIN